MQSFYFIISQSKLPCVAHQQAEVVITVDIGADGCIVVIPLFLRNDSIAVFVSKAGQEFYEDLFRGHFSTLNFRVHRAVVDDAKISLVNPSVAVLIELGESLVDHLFSLVTRFTTHANEEFIVAHDSILVRVEVLEQECSLVF